MPEENINRFSERQIQAWIEKIIVASRATAARSRRIATLLQFLTIAGAISTASIIAIGVEHDPARWSAAATSLISGISAGLRGYFKLSERSFLLTAAADAIESELEGYEARTGKYREVAAKTAQIMLIAEVEEWQERERASTYW